MVSSDDTLGSVTRHVIHLSFSSSGGAGIVASQLSESQAALGWRTQLVTGTTSSLHEAPLALPLHTLAASVDNYVLKKSTFKGLVSVSRDQMSLIDSEELLETDIVHLHWTNGLIDLADFSSKAKNQQIVWTLHDMNPFTGACHQAFSCEKFREGCQKCPAVKSVACGMVEKNFSKKADSVRALENLTVVATSPWIADLAQSSLVFAGKDLRIIPNPLRQEFFDHQVETELHNPYLLVVASDTSDPLKNIALAIEVFERAKVSHRNLSLHIVGAHASRFQGEEIFCFENLTTDQLIKKMGGALAVLVPSLAETAPLVVAEAAASGTTVVVNDIPSLRRMVGWMGVGIVAGDSKQWLGAVAKLVDSSLNSQQNKKNEEKNRAASQMFHPTAVAKKYLNLYESVL